MAMAMNRFLRRSLLSFCKLIDQMTSAAIEQFAGIPLPLTEKQKAVRQCFYELWLKVGELEKEIQDLPTED
jgi:hypothetical protein